MKLMLIILLLAATVVESRTKIIQPSPIAKKDTYQPATIELFGTKVDLPEWMDRARISILNFVSNVKKFFSGEFQISTEAFGKKVSFRTNIPDTKEEMKQSVAKFFTSVRNDTTTRVIFVIYLNLVVIFVTYTLFFIKQVQLHRRQKREEKLAKKQRKQDEEERRWLIRGEPIDDIPTLQ